MRCGRQEPNNEKISGEDIDKSSEKELSLQRCRIFGTFFLV
jgi:hypothetical protein